mmetsp:Transcript_12485/g.29665  ORF Transcript_12485/g.29665 Transcript_12485/m.29665 type:complete len:784 (+) Transcript_12485:369-2720(+)
MMCVLNIFMRKPSLSYGTNGRAVHTVFASPQSSRKKFRGVVNFSKLARSSVFCMTYKRCRNFFSCGQKPRPPRAVLAPLETSGSEIEQDVESEQIQSPKPLKSRVWSFVVQIPWNLAGYLWNIFETYRMIKANESLAEACIESNYETSRIFQTEADKEENNIQHRLRKIARSNSRKPTEKSTDATKHNKEKNKSSFLDVSCFLQKSGTLETRYMRMLSSLCSLTYKVEELSPQVLSRMHRLKLVTCSKPCGQQPVDQAIPGDDVRASNRMAASQAAESYSSQDDVRVPGSFPLLHGAVSNITPLSAEALPSRSEDAGSRLPPTELVSRKLGEAAAAAAALGGRAGEAVVTMARAPFAQSVAEQLETAAEAGGKGAEVAAAKASSSSSGPECPCEWFVADDPVSHTRYFVIQGSDNLGSWITNVTFDPVTFEGAELGVKVHRGVYSAANALYPRFLPMVREHLETSPFATVTFTGHSLGGALATVLLLMYVARGVLDRRSIKPVYTFGSAAVFCETCGAVLTEVEGANVSAPAEDTATADLLTKLNLPEGAVRNVVMHRDIVPRAFACDYSVVAPLLARVGVGFREHATLHDSTRGILYSFVGRLMVLQPDSQLTFAAGEGPHPMLPEGPGLYAFRPPGLLPQPGAAAGEVAPSASQRPKTLSAAVMAFMDSPHPLDILSDPRAYGSDGAISRYHNPDNYTRALGAVIRHRQRGSAWTSMVESVTLRRRAVSFVSRAAEQWRCADRPGDSKQRWAGARPAWRRPEPMAGERAMCSGRATRQRGS